MNTDPPNNSQQLPTHPPPNNTDQLIKLLLDQQFKLEKIYRSVEATRRYYLLNLLISFLMIALPVIVAALILPRLMGMLNAVNLPSQFNTLEKLGY